MKDAIHPKYVEAKVTCACGNSFITRSTLPEIQLDICSKCHPFFTGKQKLVDTAGRVERFQKRFKKTSGTTVRRKKKALPKKTESMRKGKKILSTVPKKIKKQKKEK
ncbi:MAG: 50S ribosomal protein L31 [Elusimicrobia bacterium]|nr:50S ribosomal protein L31 [Elusimicrobiota bacterium]MBD3412126.1 50S ribosomal protein L31 [Elusimicrobiota bacterium]